MDSWGELQLSVLEVSPASHIDIYINVDGSALACFPSFFTPTPSFAFLFHGKTSSDKNSFVLISHGSDTSHIISSFMHVYRGRYNDERGSRAERQQSKQRKRNETKYNSGPLSGSLHLHIPYSYRYRYRELHVHLHNYTKESVAMAIKRRKANKQRNLLHFNDRGRGRERERDTSSER